LVLKHDITRKQFLHFGVGAAAFITGCGGDDSTDTGAGTDSTSTDPATTDPATTNPATTDPATTDATTDPVTTDPVTTDPVTTDPSSSTDPATTDPTGESSTDADSTGTTGEAFDCSADPTVMIGANHMHTLVVTAAEIAAGAEIQYDIQGSSLHAHTVTLTDADFATLLSEGQVVVESSSSGHSHTITVTCV